MVRRGKIWQLRDKVNRTLRGKYQSEREVKIYLVSNLTIWMDNNAMNYHTE